MIALVFHCEFVAHTYQGVRLTPENKEELDWPPSPGRIHQALMSAALTGIPPRFRGAIAGGALEALRWLEKQSPPEIVASVISEDSDSATRFRLAIPQNNPAKGGDLMKTSVLLIPTLPRRAVARGSGVLKAEYVWRLHAVADQEAARKHLETLADLTAQVRYLGRAEDRFEARIELNEHDPADGTLQGCEKWQSTTQAADIDLWVATEGTTNGLVHRHDLLVPARTRKSPATRFLLRQGYTREVAESLRPVHVTIFQLIVETGDPDELPLSCDAQRAGVWRSRIRQKAVDFALDVGRWDDPVFAQELITGHPPGASKPTDQPHLAFVPLPSISSQGKADGRVRRFALIGYAQAGREYEAGEVYRVLCASLDREVIEAGKLRYQLVQVPGPPEVDKVWFQFLRSGQVWCSVTPVALARGFKVPSHTQDGSRELTSSERHVRKLSEWTSLLRCSLRHICLPENLVTTCSIALTPSPLVLHTGRAEDYRPPGESAVLTHARIEFAKPVRGPLIIGDRRYQGYGLFAPY